MVSEAFVHYYLLIFPETRVLLIFAYLHIGRVERIRTYLSICRMLLEFSMSLLDLIFALYRQRKYSLSKRLVLMVLVQLPQIVYLVSLGEYSRHHPIERYNVPLLVVCNYS